MHWLQRGFACRRAGYAAHDRSSLALPQRTQTGRGAQFTIALMRRMKSPDAAEKFAKALHDTWGVGDAKVRACVGAIGAACVSSRDGACEMWVSEMLCVASWRWWSTFDRVTRGILRRLY